MTHTPGNTPTEPMTHCDECGSEFPSKQFNDNDLPPQLDCPWCHNEPNIADAIVVNRLNYRAQMRRA